MANSNNNFNPESDAPLPPDFMHWPSDTYIDDDDEFLAGYPFSPLPDYDSNGSWELYNCLSTSDNAVFQLTNSDDDVPVSTTTDIDQLNDSSSELPEQVLVLIESNPIDECDENHDIDAVQQNGHNDQELNGHSQYDVLDQINNINTGDFE